MYSKMNLGDYYPIKSIIHRLNPINKIFCLILYILFLVFTISLKLHLTYFVFLILIMLLSLVPFRFYFNIVFSLRYILVILVCALLVLSVSPDLIVVIVLKIIMSVMMLSILTFTTSSSELAYGIEKILMPINLFNINFSKPINGIIGLIKFIPFFVTTEYSVLKAIESRGINYRFTNVINKLNIKKKMFGSVYSITKRKIKLMKQEATLRMFSYKKYRTNYKVNKYGFFDLLYSIISISFIILILYERGYLSEILVKLNI